MLRDLLLGEPAPWTQLTRAVAELAQAQEKSEERLATLTSAVHELQVAVASLAEAQRRTEERLEPLAEAQRRTEEWLNLLGQRMAELAEAQRRTEERLEALAEAQRRTEERLNLFEQRMAELAEAQRQTELRLGRLARQVEILTGEVGKLKGSDLERRYRERAPAYFARLLRRVHALTSEELAEMIDDAEEKGRISEEEREDLLGTDVVVYRLSREDSKETYLAVEVSGRIAPKDVERAVRRAALIEKLTKKEPCPWLRGKS